MDTQPAHVAWYRVITPVPHPPEYRPRLDTGSNPTTPDAANSRQRAPEPALPLARQTVTVEEAAAILGIGRTAAYEGVKRGHIPSIRVNRRVLVPLPALEALLGGR
jgi:excisionase family DNA binding protein